MDEQLNKKNHPYHIEKTFLKRMLYWKTIQMLNFLFCDVSATKEQRWSWFYFEKKILLVALLFNHYVIDLEHILDDFPASA